MRDIYISARASPPPFRGSGEGFPCRRNLSSPRRNHFSALLSSLLQRCSPVEDSWLLLSVQVGEQAGKGERVMKWGEGKRHLPISITYRPPIAVSSGEAPSPFLCVLKYPTPWMLVTCLYESFLFQSPDPFPLQANRKPADQGLSSPVHCCLQCRGSDCGLWCQTAQGSHPSSTTYYLCSLWAEHFITMCLFSLILD